LNAYALSSSRRGYRQCVSAITRPARSLVSCGSSLHPSRKLRPPADRAERASPFQRFDQSLGLRCWQVADLRAKRSNLFQSGTRFIRPPLLRECPPQEVARPGKPPNKVATRRARPPPQSIQAIRSVAPRARLLSPQIAEPSATGEPRRGREDERPWPNLDSRGQNRPAETGRSIR
jgi:hypothetical protein